MFTYEPAIRDAVTALKYRDIRVLGPVLGDLMADALPGDVIEEPLDALVPVPISRNRIRSRGYNQSELLAKAISERTHIPVANDLVARRGDSQPQANAQSIEERRSNVQGAFAVTGAVQEKRVLLIDDVMTTGSTLNACARELTDAGVPWVGSLVLAREL